MPETPHNAPRRAPWKPAVALLLPYTIVVAVAAVAMARRGASLPVEAKEVATRLVLSLLMIETVALAVGIPFLTAQGREGLRARLLGVAAPAAALALISLIVSAVAVRGSVPVAVLVCCQVFLLCFAALIAVGTTLLSVLALRPATAQLVVSAVALAMLGSIFFANAAIESLPAGAPRSCTVQALLWTNPWLVVGGTILEADPIRAKRLYHQSVISYYGFRYPASERGLAARTLTVSAAYSACALLLWAVARLGAHIRRSRARR